MKKQWTDHFLDVNGVRIHYTRTGDGTRPALVLAHGFSDYGMCWQALAAELDDDYDIILPDARGHGQSARVMPGKRVDMAADLAGLIQALKLDRPVLGGHSMGASTAAQVEARYPGLVRALVLEDPGWHDPRPEPEGTAPKPNPWYEWLVSLPGTPLEVVEAKGRADSPTWPEAEFRPWAESKLQLDTDILQAEQVRPDWRDVARAILCPTLLITADPACGAIVTPEMAAEAKRLSAAIQVVNVAGAGHCIRREKGEAYLAAVRAFLAEVV